MIARAPGAAGPPAARMACCALLAAALALAGGCSLIRFGYGQLDTFAVHVADDYFDLEPGQRQDFLARFDRLHAWHRREQLPEYAAFLAEARKRFDRGATREDIAWLMSGVEERFRTIARRGSADAAALLSTVAQRQLGALRRQWDKDNDKFVREHDLDGTPKEQRAASVRRLVRQIEKWTGSLTRAQDLRVAALSEQAPPIERLRHADRMRRQREFLKLMESRHDGAAFEGKLRHWLVNWEDGRSPAEARQFRDAREKRIEIYLSVARTLTEAQRAHLAERVDGFIGDFTRLAGN